MKEVYFAVGGFAGGFIVCWFFAATIKQDIAVIASDVKTILLNLSKKV